MSGSFDDLEDETYEKTVKAAQSSFALMKYDKESDSSVVLCRPETVCFVLFCFAMEFLW